MLELLKHLQNPSGYVGSFAIWACQLLSRYQAFLRILQKQRALTYEPTFFGLYDGRECFFVDNLLTFLTNMRICFS